MHSAAFFGYGNFLVEHLILIECSDRVLTN